MLLQTSPPYPTELLAPGRWSLNKLIRDKGKPGGENSDGVRGKSRFLLRDIAPFCYILGHLFFLY